MKQRVLFKKLNPNAKIPTCGSPLSAGYDLYACLEQDVRILPGENVKIPTGFAATCPDGYYGAIVPRSGMGIKRGLRPANSPGTIDQDYTGEWIVALYNDSDEIQIIHPGDRVAQVIFLPYLQVDFEEVETLEETERGAGGFGSTGTN